MFILPQYCELCGATSFKDCFSTNDKLYGTGKNQFHIWQCTHCGFYFTYPVPPNLESVYPDFYYSLKNDTLSSRNKIIKYVKNPHKIPNAVLLKITNMLEQLFFKRSIILVKGGNILDVGCGYGDFLLKMKKMGMHVYGIEPGNYDVNFSQKHGLDIKKGTLSEIKWQDDFFDVVTLNHSFEHIPNSRETVKELYRIVKSGGYIIVAVPNVDSLMRKIFCTSWLHWDVPRHLYHYFPNILKKLFIDEGFISLRERHLYSGYAFSLSLENTINYIRHKKIVLANSGMMNNSIIRLLGLITFGTIPVLLRKGDVIELIFRKPGQKIKNKKKSCNTNDKVELSIVIINYNTCNLLLQCLKSIYENTTDLDFEILLIDNNSQDESIATVCKHYPTVRTIQNSENLGFAKAANIGASYALGDYICFLNTDTYLVNNAMKETIRLLKENAKAGIVGPLIYNPDMTIQQSVTELSFWGIVLKMLTLRNTTQGKWNIRNHTEYMVVEKGKGLLGACLLMRKDFFLKLGGFDENFFFTGEEGDLILEARRKGWQILQSFKGAIIHHHGATIKRIESKEKTHILYSYYSGILYFIEKNYGKIPRLITFLLISCQLFIKFLFWSVKSLSSRDALLKASVYKFILTNLNKLKNNVNSNKNKIVLLLSSDLSITGGIPRYTYYQVKTLKELGYKIFLITSYEIGDFFNHNLFEEIFSFYLPHGARLNALQKVRFFFHTLILAKKIKFDFILVNQLSLAPVAYLCNKVFNIPYILNIYGAELWSNPKYIDIFAIRRANAIFADSKHTVDYACTCLGVNPNKIHLVYDPVDIYRFKPRTRDLILNIFDKYKIPHDKKIVLTLSRLDRFKGHELVIEIIDKLPDDVVYIIGGNGEKLISLKKLAESKDKFKKIYFTDKIDEVDLPFFYNIADIFILISKKEHGEGEGLPLSLIEASASGIPIIAGNEDGSVEAVENGLNGYIVSPRDTNELLSKLLMLFSDMQKRIELGYNGREFAKKKFSLDNFRDKHKILFDIICSKRSG